MNKFNILLAVIFAVFLITNVEAKQKEEVCHVICISFRGNYYIFD